MQLGPVPTGKSSEESDRVKTHYQLITRGNWTKWIRRKETGGQTPPPTQACARGRPKRVITDGGHAARGGGSAKLARGAHAARADINNERALSNAPRETTNSGRSEGRRAGPGRRVIYGAARARGRRCTTNGHFLLILPFQPLTCLLSVELRPPPTPPPVVAAPSRSSSALRLRLPPLRWN